MIFQPTAEENLRKAIHAAESLGATTIRVVRSEANCPKMDEESPYGPVVVLLHRISGVARDAGVTIGMETSLVPADDRKFINLVNRANVQVYYDLDNVERYARTGEALSLASRCCGPSAKPL